MTRESGLQSGLLDYSFFAPASSQRESSQVCHGFCVSLPSSPSLLSLPPLWGLEGYLCSPPKTWGGFPWCLNLHSS